MVSTTYMGVPVTWRVSGNQFFKTLPIIAVCAVLSARPASAATLNIQNPLGTMTASPPYATVTVSVSSNTLASVTFTAAPGFMFVDGSSVDLNIVSGGSFTAFESPSGGSATSSTINKATSQVASFGSFNLTDDLTGGNLTAQTISLALFGAGTTWLTSFLIPNENGLDIAAHMAQCSDNPCTSLDGDTNLSGLVGFVTTTSQTPLPAALPLFATGLGGLGLLGWRRKRKAQAVRTVIRPAGETL
jgi:hypothetical protein